MLGLSLAVSRCWTGPHLLLSMGDALLSRLPLLFVPLYCCSWLLLPVVALLYFWSGVLLLLPAGL